MVLPETLKNLQISEDGTRLGIQFAASYKAQIWDTQDTAERQKYYEERSLAKQNARLEADQLMQSDIPLNELIDFVLADKKRRAVHKLVLVPLLQAEVRGIQNRAEDVLKVWRYRLLASPQLTESLRKEGIVASRREQEALENALAEFKAKAPEELLEECWNLLTVARVSFNNDPFTTKLSERDAMAEGAACLTLLDPATARLPLAKLCQAQLAYRLDASPRTKQAVHDTIEQAGEAGIDLWPRLALVYAEEGRFDDARQCLNRLIPNGESSVLAQYSRDPFAGGSDVKTFLIRSSSGDIIQAPDNYQPRGNPKRLSDEAWSSVKQTWEILKKAKSGKQ